MQKSVFQVYYLNFLLRWVGPSQNNHFPPPLGVPNSEKFMDKAFKSIKYSHFQKVVILSIFVQSFNILPKVLNPKCYTILETIFDAYEGDKVKNTTFRSF